MSNQTIEQQKKLHTWAEVVERKRRKQALRQMRRYDDNEMARIEMHREPPKVWDIVETLRTYPIIWFAALAAAIVLFLCLRS